MKKSIGQIISGSFTKGLLLKLSNEYNIEDLRIGKFVIIEGEKTKFFSMVTDIHLESNNEKILNFIPFPHPKEDFIKEVLKGTSVFGIVHLTPYLMVDLKTSLKAEESVPKVKTIPPHFSCVYEATESDIEQIFGKEEKRHTVIKTHRL